MKRSRSSGQQAIRYDRYRMSPAEIAVAWGKAAAVCGALAYTFYRSMAAFRLMLPVGLALVTVYEHRRLKAKRRVILAGQFKEAMIVLASSLSAGFSIENALGASLNELKLLYGKDGLIVNEFSYMVQQIRMNRSVEQALGDFAERSGLEDVQNFSEVFCVAKRSGGDLSGIMRHTAEVIRDKMQVKEEIRTMTASRQFEQKIMNMLPFFIVFYVELSSPGFFDQMYKTGLGRLLMSVCLAAYLVAIVLSRRILDIRV